MKLFKTILMTCAVTLPLGFFIAILLDKPHTLQQSEQPPIKPAIISAPLAINANTTDTPPQNNAVLVLTTQVQHLQADVTALREELHSMVKTKAATAILGRDPDKKPPSTDDAIQAEEEKYFAKQGEALSADFRQQSIAPGWSTETVALVKAGLASDKISETSIISLECRTRTCRLELANTRKNKVPDFMAFPQYIAGELSNILISQPESTDGATVFYLSKEELMLPN
jgi:hypothetical protein